METFSIIPSYTTRADIENKVNRVMFGDRYEQRAPDGINARQMTFQVVFRNVTRAKAQSVVDFFNLVGGADAFNWTPPAPHDTAGTYVLQQPWNWEVDGFDNETIVAVFQQDFNEPP